MRHSFWIMFIRKWFKIFKCVKNWFNGVTNDFIERITIKKINKKAFKYTLKALIGTQIQKVNLYSKTSFKHLF